MSSASTLATDPPASGVAPLARSNLVFGSTKIQPTHRERLALVYVRQSTPQQVLENRESTALQYGLADRAVQLGWHPERVLVIDEDTGQSGRSAEGRLGFQRLLAEVGLDHVGLVLGIEMSRLARSCKDWYRLLELCALFRTLLADQDGLYDPTDFNDRLLLGLKGTMSEAELHIIRNRMDNGRKNKARRGELFSHMPIGYVILPSGEIVLDPDERIPLLLWLVWQWQRDHDCPVDLVLVTGDLGVSARLLDRTASPVCRPTLCNHAARPTHDMQGDGIDYHRPLSWTASAAAA